MTKLREKYIERGQVGGQVILEGATSDERRELASFLGKPPYKDRDVKVRLVDIDHALKNSGFSCTLPELLSVFFPNQPLVTRPEQRAAHADYQNTFRASLQSIASELPATSLGRSWLEQGAHGLEWLFSRYKNASREDQEHQLSTIRYIASILDRLPGATAPQRLALFAQSTSGNPHMLDPNTSAGRLLLLALSDLSGASSPPQERAQELRLYTDVGLLVDTISSYVAVFNLESATYQNGSPDPLLQAAGRRVLLLPQRQLLEWSSLRPSGAAIYVIENPQVFEEVIAGLQETEACPTLICTAGWPSTAALTVLDMLLASSPDHHFYYSGDFDLKGLQIAAYLLARYSERCHPWHLDSSSYGIALQAGGVTAPINDLKQLNTLPSVFARLVASIQEQKQWAYQEGITHLLRRF